VTSHGGVSVSREAEASGRGRAAPSPCEQRQWRLVPKLEKPLNSLSSLEELELPLRPLLLLPLVENAFKYVGGAYHLQICAKEKEGHLQFTVKNSTLASLPPQKESGIGLENLRRRLALLYPNQHELKTTKQGDEFHASLLVKLKPHEN